MLLFVSKCNHDKTCTVPKKGIKTNKIKWLIIKLKNRKLNLIKLK